MLHIKKYKEKRTLTIYINVRREYWIGHLSKKDLTPKDFTSLAKGNIFISINS